MAATRVATASLHVEGDANLRWHDLGYAKYGFCGECSSLLFYVAADRTEVTSIMVGSLTNSSGLELGAVWFSDEAQTHNVLPAGVPHHGGNG